jgi:4-amino-4-deoxy-L-arabinose transferase-like glycosyltransferase
MNSSFQKKIRVAFWLLAIALGAAQAWISRFDIVNDTISYLDMGDYFFHGHPAAIINGIWSPLYAMLLGATLFIFKPSPYMEYPVIHLLLFFVFLFTLASFDFFLRQLALLRGGFASNSSAHHSDWPWIAIAFIIFIWSSLGLIGVYETNPDMLVAAFFYLACGLLVKISRGHANWKTFLGFGAVLGLSYLTKGAMFPLSLILLFTAWLAAKSKSRYILVSVSAFILIAIPFIAALSAQKGHLTWGESGNYNYAVHVNGIARHHWQGDTQTAGMPIHPTREIFLAPATFEFNGPLLGTYPAWYDPTFWYEGVKPHLNVHQQFKAASRNLLHEFQTVFYALNGILFATLFLAFIEAKSKLPIFENIFRCWFLLLPSVIGLVLYALVHYEPRYVGPFFAVFCVCLFSCILWADDFPNRRFYSGIVVLQLGLVLWIFATPAFFNLRHPWSSEKGSYQAVAEGAVQMGLRPGDQVASLNFSNLGTAMWARLARVQIIAEVFYWPDGPEGSANCFWSADPVTQEKLLQRLSQTGAKAVVSSDLPTGPGATRWSRIGDTGYYLLWLNPESVKSQ